MMKQTGIALAFLLPLAPAGAQTTAPVNKPAATTAAAAPTAKSALAGAPVKTHQVYDVVREGSKIGTDTIEIERQGDVTNIKMATNILVKVMFIEAYRYKHSANESWKAGQLVSFKSQTDDNGTKHTVTLTPPTPAATPAPTPAAPDKLSLDVDGHRTDVPKTIAPATLWSRDVGKHLELFDPADGKQMAVKITDMGMETLTIQGAPRQTHHFRMAGDLERDLWFDGDLLVRMRLLGSDHSAVTSELREAEMDPQQK